MVFTRILNEEELDRISGGVSTEGDEVEKSKTKAQDAFQKIGDVPSRKK